MVTGIVVLKKTLAEVRKASIKLFQGEITVSKKECWLAGMILTLSGIAIGLVNAPLTHGVNISVCSNNGNNNGNAHNDTINQDKSCKSVSQKKDAPKQAIKADKSKDKKEKKKWKGVWKNK